MKDFLLIIERYAKKCMQVPDDYHTDDLEESLNRKSLAKKTNKFQWIVIPHN